MTLPARVLLGRDAAAPGRVTVVDGGTVAAACSAGARVVTGALRDANEDAAVLAGVGGAWMVAVVDGNGTAAGAEAVADHLVACVPGLLAADPPAPGEALVGAMAALHHARRAGAHATGASATLVVGRPGCAWTASRGDTAAVVVGPDGLRPLAGVVPPPVGPLPVPGPAVVDLGAQDVVVLASDGLFAALGGAWPDALRRVPDASPAVAAQRLVAGALARGADDAVTVVVAVPGRDGASRG